MINAKLKEVVWKWDYGVYLPFCPYCDEPAYEKKRCFACGKDYKWVDGKIKPKEVSKGEYTAVQATNNHLHIYEKGKLVMHSACDKPYTEEELLQRIDRFIAFRESGVIEKLLEDESEE